MRGASAAKSLKFAKPPKRATEKAKRDKARAAHILAIRRQVFARDAGCRICGGPGDEMHEIVSRAKTRGLPNEQRWNLENCVRLCARCHREVTEHRLRIGVALDVISGEICCFAERLLASA